MTDGVVGPARLDLSRRLADRGVLLHAVLPKMGWRGYLDAMAATVTVLLPLGG